MSIIADSESKQSELKKLILKGKEQGFLTYREINDHLPDTIVDVTTLKELVRRWYPDVGTYAKAGSHRALDDIVESIDELRWYRSHCLLDVARPAAPVASESPS